MIAIEGTGVLLCQGREFAVSYALTEPSDQLGLLPAEGTVFGDPEPLQSAFDHGRCVLRLQSGDEAEVLLLDLLGQTSRSAADFRALGPFGRTNS
ncbi:MAG: hypothetical protein ABIO39_09095 [Caulobacteraceae bacterium]